MRQLFASLLIALPLAVLAAACGGADSGDMVSIDQSDLKSCAFPKAAHCYCQTQGGANLDTGATQIPPTNSPAVLFTYVIPDKCYNQVFDLAASQEGGGCWKDCRNAFGVEGATRDPGVTTLLNLASQELRAEGACGGWVNAPLNFAAGTNKYREDTAVGIGIGIGGTVVMQNGHPVCR